MALQVSREVRCAFSAGETYLVAFGTKKLEPDCSVPQLPYCSGGIHAVGGGMFGLRHPGLNLLLGQSLGPPSLRLPLFL